jgi:hypothetical protein
MTIVSHALLWVLWLNIRSLVCGLKDAVICWYAGGRVVCAKECTHYEVESGNLELDAEIRK